MSYSTPRDSGADIRSLVEKLRGSAGAPLPEVSKPEFDASVMDRPKPMSLITDELPSMQDLGREVSPFGRVNMTEGERRQAMRSKNAARMAPKTRVAGKPYSID